MQCYTTPANAGTMANSSLFNAAISTPYRWIGPTADSQYARKLDIGLSKMLYKKMTPWRSDRSSISDASPQPIEEDGSVNNFSILSLSYSKDGKFLVAGSSDHNVYLYNPNSGKNIGSIKGAHNGSVSSLQFISDFQFVSASEDSTIAIWDIRKASEAINCLNGHGSFVRKLMYSEHSNGMLLSSSMDNTVRYWHLPSFQQQNDFLLADNEENETCRGVLCRCPNLAHVALSPNNQWLAVVNSQGWIFMIYNLDIPELHFTSKKMKLDEALVMQLAWINPNCSLTKKNRIRVLSKDEYTPSGHGVLNRVMSVEFHPEHCFLMMRVIVSHIVTHQITEWSCGVNLQQKQSLFDKSWLTISSFGSEILEQTLMFSEQEQRSGLIDKDYSFSNYGRLFASPGKSHLRLLAFSENLDDPYATTKYKGKSLLSSVFSISPNSNGLTEVANIPINGKILCSKLSPVGVSLAVGDNSGNVHFVQPS